MVDGFFEKLMQLPFYIVGMQLIRFKRWLAKRNLKQLLRRMASLFAGAFGRRVACASIVAAFVGAGIGAGVSGAGGADNGAVVGAGVGLVVGALFGAGVAIVHAERQSSHANFTSDQAGDGGRHRVGSAPTLTFGAAPARAPAPAPAPVSLGDASEGAEEQKVAEGEIHEIRRPTAYSGAVNAASNVAGDVRLAAGGAGGNARSGVDTAAQAGIGSRTEQSLQQRHRVTVRADDAVVVALVAGLVAAGVTAGVGGGTGAVVGVGAAVVGVAIAVTVRAAVMKFCNLAVKAIDSVDKVCGELSAFVVVHTCCVLCVYISISSV